MIKKKHEKSNCGLQPETTYVCLYIATHVLLFHVSCLSASCDTFRKNTQVCEFFQIMCRYLADHLLTPALRCANNLLPKPASNAASAALREMTGGAGQLPPRVSGGAPPLCVHLMCVVVANSGGSRCGRGCSGSL